MKINNREKKLDLNMVCLILLIIRAALNFSTYFSIPKWIDLLIELFCYGNWLLSIIKYNYPRKIYIILLFLFVLIIYTSYVTDTSMLISSFMLCILALFEKKGDISKNISIGLIIGFFINAIPYIINLLEKNIIVLPDNSGRIRYLLGFIHPNIASYFALWYFISRFYYIINTKQKIKKLIPDFIFIIIVYFFTRSNALLIFLFLLFVALFASKNDRLSKLYGFLCKYGVIIISVSIVILSILYGKGNFYVKKLDEITNARIYYSYLSLKKYGVTFLGQNINMDEIYLRNNIYRSMKNNIIIDVTYTNLLVRYGVIYILILNYLGFLIGKKGEKIDKIVFILWMIYGISETVCLNFLICFPPIIGCYYFQKKGDENYE